MTEINERAIETDRGRVAYLEAGAGWPVVLIHAFPLAAEMWRPQLERVPMGSWFIAPDLRGFGRSPLSAIGSRPITIDDYAEDVGALMDALEIESATIGGLSMGGYVTLAMHRQSPERFNGMVLADTKSQADTPQGREGRVRLREALAAGGPRAVADQMLPMLLAGIARDDTPGADARVRAIIEAASPDGIDAAIGALIERPDATSGLAAISCATFVVVGEHDEITPVAAAESMQRAIARSTLTVIPRAGHLSNIDQPAAFSQALDDFVRSHL